MASSGTFSFAPTSGDILAQAYARVQVMRPSIQLEHLQNGRMELNLLFSEWSNKQVNLRNVELDTTALVAGTATYNVDAQTVDILDAYVSPAGSTTTDRIITRISRSEYAAYPNKAQSGEPSMYFFNRQIAPTITLFPVPTTTDTLKYWRVTQLEDANLPGGETPNAPYRWFDAMVAGLAHRLARIYRPAMEQIRKADAMEAWTIAAGQDVEGVSITLRPNLGGYYR